MQEANNTKLYGGDFHTTRDDQTKYDAERILSIVYREFQGLNRVIDVGCGVGTFLCAAKAHGAKYIKGLDGNWVKQNELVISSMDFQEVDLSNPPPMDETYDLVINLEVAEHLAKESAEHFIQWLCNLAPVILFSAAIPGQGGVGHRNEAWLSYWVGLFGKQGFRPLDLIRPEIWGDQNIYFWYRQNTMIFIKNNRPHQIRDINFAVDIVHPELYMSKIPPKSNSLSTRLLRQIVRLVKYGIQK